MSHTGARVPSGVDRPSTSLGRAFAQLYRKDLQQLQFTLVLFSVLIAVWDVFLLTRVQVWESWLALGLSLIPLVFIPLWLIWDAIQSYRAEWHSGSIYFMLGAPVPGWIHALSKLAAVMTSFTVQSALALGGTWLLFTASRGAGMVPEIVPILRQVPGWYLNQGLAALIGVYWLQGLAIALSFQAAYVASQLATRFQFLALLGALVVEQWLAFRAGGLGHYLFSWVPDLHVTGYSFGPQGPRVIPDSLVIDSGPLLGWALAGIILFAVTAWLIQEAVEVS